MQIRTNVAIYYLQGWRNRLRDKRRVRCIMGQDRRQRSRGASAVWAVKDIHRQV